jgi:hypothetical protein
MECDAEYFTILGRQVLRAEEKKVICSNSYRKKRL